MINENLKIPQIMCSTCLKPYLLSCNSYVKKYGATVYRLYVSTSVVKNFSEFRDRMGSGEVKSG